jgi:hypothetical protein
MAFNQQEQDIIKYGIANGKTKDQVIQAITNYRTGVVPTPAPQTTSNPTQTNEPSLINKIGTDFANRGQDIVNQFNTTGQEVKNVGGGIIPSLAGATEVVARGAGEVAGGLINAGLETGKALINKINGDNGETLAKSGDSFLNATNILGQTNRETLTKVGDLIKGGTDNLPPNVVQSFKNFFDTVGLMGAGGKVLETPVAEIPGIIKNGANNISNTVINTSKGLVDSVSPTINNVVETGNNVRTKVESLINPIKTTEQAVKQIGQGLIGDTKSIQNALESIDTTGVNTFEQLQSRINDSIPALSKKVDMELAKDTNVYNLKDLSIKGKTKGGKIVTTDYISKGLKDLKELYTSIGDKVSAGNVDELISKSKSGLTRLEVNNIARTYGKEFGSKAFSKIGEPLTSVNAQAFENTRSGLKSVARQGLGGKEAQAIDSTISDLYDTKTLIDKNVEAVNKLKQRINERGLIEKAGYLVAKYADMFTGGTIRGFVGGVLPRGAGYKVMNAIDIESALRKNLDIIEKANKAKTDSKFIEILQSSNPPSNSSTNLALKESKTITTNSKKSNTIKKSMTQSNQKNK